MTKRSINMRHQGGSPDTAAAFAAVTQQSSCLVTANNISHEIDPRKGDLDAQAKACAKSPMARLAKSLAKAIRSAMVKAIIAYHDAIAPIRAGLDAFRQLARQFREICRQERRAQRIHNRAGLKRAPRRRAASTSVRRVTTDAGGDGDGEPPRRRTPRARGPPLSRVGRAAPARDSRTAPETARDTDASPCPEAVGVTHILV